MNVTRLNLTSFILLLKGVIAHILCIALPRFAYGDIYYSRIQETIIFRMGLFQVCFYGGYTETCVAIGGDGPIDAFDWQKACQALAIIGVIFAAGGLGLTGLAIFKESRGDRMRLLPLIIFALCGAGALICFIGDIVFAAEKDKFHTNTLHLSWGFGIDIVACAFIALSGVIQIKIARMGGQSGGMV